MATRMRMRCLRCSKIIERSPYDTQILLDHIRTDHPEIKLPHDDMGNLDSPDESPIVGDPLRWDEDDARPSDPQPRRGGVMEEETIRNIGRKPMYTRKYKVHSPRVAQSPQKRRMYKTSIEKWRPAKGRIYCPKCGCNKRPIIRTRSEKMSYSSAGAACILTCWPLCFLPCLFPANAKEYLYCAECSNFLGMYDRHNNCVRPNRNFMEDLSGSSGRLSKASDRPSEEPPGESMAMTNLKEYPKEDFPPTEDRKVAFAEKTEKTISLYGQTSAQLHRSAADPSLKLQNHNSEHVQGPSNGEMSEKKKSITLKEDQARSHEKGD